MSVIYSPKSLSELDRIADQFAGALSDVFDFNVSEKKREKLREATCRALGYPNGLQQAKADFTLFAGPRISDEAFDSLPDTMAIEVPDLDEYEIQVGATTLSPLKSGLNNYHRNLIPIQNILNRFSIDDEDSVFIGWDESARNAMALSHNALSEALYGLDIETLIGVLRSRYTVTRVHASIPDVDKYGVAPIAASNQSADFIERQYGFDASGLTPDEVFVTDMGDDSGDHVAFLIEKR